MVYQRSLHPDELMHFGVPRMKWGVRKSRENKNKFYSRTGQRRSMGREEQARRQRKFYSKINGAKRGLKTSAALYGAGAAAGLGAAALHKYGKSEKTRKAAGALAAGSAILGTAGAVRQIGAGVQLMSAGHTMRSKRKKRR